MINKYSVSTSLYLYGDTLVSDTVTSFMGVNPSKTREKGEKKILSSGAMVTQKNTGFWRLDNDPSLDNANLSTQINWIKNKISNRKCEILKIPGVEVVCIDIFITTDKKETVYNAIQIEPKDLNWLSTLNVRVDISFML